MVPALAHQAHRHSDCHCCGYPVGQSIQGFGSDVALDQRLPQCFEDLSAVVFGLGFAGEEAPGRTAIEHFVLGIKSLNDVPEDLAAVEPGQRMLVVVIHIIHDSSKRQRSYEAAGSERHSVPTTSLTRRARGAGPCVVLAG